MEENLRLLKPYIRGLPIIILAMIIGFLIAKKYLNYVVPMYESTAKLRLADVSEGIPSSQLFKDLDVFATASRISAEIEVLKSNVLINQTLDILDYDIEIFRKGNIRTTELYDQSPLKINYTVIEKDAYDKLYDLKVLNKSDYILSDPETNTIINGTIGDTLKLPELNLVVNFNNGLLSKKPYLDYIDNFQFKILSRQSLVNNIRKNLDVIAVEEDVPVIRISYKSQNPAKASILTNKLTEEYIKDYIDNKYKAANITVDFLEGQINYVLEKLSESEEKIQQLRDQRGITNIFQETETDLRKIANLKIQQTNIKMNLEAIQDLDKYIKEGEDNFLELAPNFETFTDLLSTEIVKKIKELQSERRDLLMEFTPDNEKVKVVDGKIRDLTSYLSESISNTRRNLEIKYNRLCENIDEAEKAFIGIPEKERLLTIFNREFNIYQQSYNFLNEKKIEAEIAQAAKIAFHRIISYGQVPKEPISPNRVIILSISVLLGMFGSIILIYFVHLWKAKVNDKQTIETNSTIPIAMFTPYLNNKSKQEHHFLKEAVHLEIKGLIKHLGVICFSSFNQRDGASFNTLKMAEAFARQNRKVLLIDAANTMQIGNGNGVQIEPFKENIDLITLNAPAYDLFTKSKMLAHLKTLKNNYDITVVLNEEIENHKSLLLMSLASTNFVVLDSRLTPAKKIIQTELLAQEYDLPMVRFTLNRYGYNPNVISEMVIAIIKLTRKIRTKFSKK